MSTEDDEKLARALQQQYEKQAQKRSQQMSSRRIITPPSTESLDAGISSGSEDGSNDGATGGARRPRRGRRPKPVGDNTSSIHESNHETLTQRERSSHRRTKQETKKEEEFPDIESDAEMARRLAESEERRARGEKSSHRRTTGVERSSHHRTPAEERKEEAKDARGERSRRTADAVRSNQQKSAENKKEESRNPQTDNDAEMARRLAEKKERRARGERSSHDRTVDAVRSNQHTSRENKRERNPQIDNDAEMARRLAEKEQRRARGERSSHHRTTDVERSIHHSKATEEKKEEEEAPDTSNDAEVARRLAEKEERRARGERSYHRRTIPLEPPTSSAPSETVPDTSNDAQLARRLSQEMVSKPRRRIKPVEEMEIVSHEVALNDVDDDEVLARKLEQELKDEELALRLNGEETKRRRRTSYLARKKAAQRSSKRKDGSAADGNERSSLISPESADSDVLAAVGKNDRDRGRSSKRSGDSDASRSQYRSRSRDSYDTDDIGSSPRRSQSKGRTRNASGSNSPSARSNLKGRSKSPIRMEQALVLDLHEESDRDLALKFDQEARDEALARSLNKREARRISVYQVEVAETTRGRKRWNFRRVISLGIPVVVILAAVVGLAFAFSGGDGLPSFPGGSPPTFEDEDPFNGATPDEANRWRRSSGLDLDVLNALNKQWDTNFDIAISEWNVGADALDLSVFSVAIDNNCERVPGKLKVCNGDYGETKWRGINQVILSNGYIISSIAKLNEFYLAGADEAQRQYTMCHEIGHGFGLPHTDENFFNADLGNCMDYTSNPEVNKSPDQSNFSFLMELYGRIGGRRNLRSRRRVDVPRKEYGLPEEPSDLLLRVEEAMYELENGELFSKGSSEAKVLHSSEFSEAVRIDLGDGFKLQVSKLLAV